MDRSHGAWESGKGRDGGMGGGPAASCRSGAGGTARLRIEYFSNKQSKALGWAVYFSTIVIQASVVALVVYKFNAQEEDVLFRTNVWYTVNASIAGACLGSLLLIVAWFAVNLHSTRAARRSWSYRRMLLCRGAAVILAIQVFSTVFWLTPYVVAATHRCSWFDNSLAWMSLMRWTAYNSIFFVTLTTAHECCRYRGPSPSPNPDEQLVMDCALNQKVRVHALKVLLWAVTEAAVILRVITQLRNKNEALADRTACEDQQYVCDISSGGYAVIIVELCLIGFYAVAYAVYLWRAFKDHEALPYARYRLTNIYIRLMARHGVAAFVTVLFSIIMLSAVRFQSCWSYLDGVLGIAPVQLSLCLLVAVQVVALMPKKGKTRDVLITCMQQFSWTEAGLPAAIAAREQEQQAAQASEQEGLQRLLSGGRRLLRRASLLGTGSYGSSWHGKAEQQQQRQQPPQQADSGRSLQPELSSKLQEGMLKAGSGLQASGGGAAWQPQDGWQQPLASQPSAELGTLSSLTARLSSALHICHRHQGEQRRQVVEPMFCLELAIRLFHWTKYSYRHWLGAAGLMDQGVAQRLFGFTGFEAFHDVRSDTRALLSWRDGLLLLAFRGTASAANALTDVKAWQVPVLPRRYHSGRLVKVHAGFYQAYTANATRDTLLARIQEIVAGFSCAASGPPGSGLRLLLTGHSLGGSLAILAAHDLARLFPAAQTTLYTFGSPRVGNKAFASEYRCLVPDSWGVVNDQDPVARIPTYGFRHCSLPVVVNSRGDIIVRPSYFERVVLSRSGGVVQHHQLLRYALSIAAVLKAQFSASKWLPGGEAGAAELATTLDLGTALLLRNVDLASLRDPSLRPKTSERPAAKRKAVSSLSDCGALCGGTLSWCAGPEPAAEDERRRLHPAANKGIKEDAAAALQATVLEEMVGVELQGGSEMEEQAQQQDQDQHQQQDTSHGLGGEAAELASDAAATARGAAAVATDAAVHTIDAMADAASAAPLPLLGRLAWWRRHQRPMANGVLDVESQAVTASNIAEI